MMLKNAEKAEWLNMLENVARCRAAFRSGGLRKWCLKFGFVHMNRNGDEVSPITGDCLGIPPKPSLRRCRMNGLSQWPIRFRL